MDVQADRMCLILVLNKIQYAFKSIASRLKSGGDSSKLAIFFFNLVHFFFKTKIGQLSVTGLSNLSKV